MISGDIEERLRLLVITDALLAAPRTVEEIVARALEGGARAVQLRNKGDSARDILALGRTLRTLTRAAGALLFVNDRLDVALAVDADGVHVGPEDLPVAVVRAVSPAGFLVGRSARDPEAARRAVREGADFIGCGSVYPTSTKTDVGDIIGLDGLRRVVESVEVPVLAIGGITAERASEVAAAGAAGIAAVGALMRAPDPAAAARALLAPFRR